MIRGTKTLPLVKRADPSPYPGSDSNEFVNEPLYLNFNIDDEADLGRVEDIHYGFGNEVSALIRAGRSAVNDGDRTIFARFFEDDDPETRTVTQVFDSLLDEDGQPSSLVKTFFFDNTDFLALCVESNDPFTCINCDTVFGYTAVDSNGDGLEKTHFCNTAFAFPDLERINCDSLDQYPSAAMDNLGRVMLNLFVRYSSVGPQTDVNQVISDANNSDGFTAYYPSRSHGLLVQDNKGSASDVNADSYAWLGLVRFFTPFCFVLFFFVFFFVIIARGNSKSENQSLI